MQIIKPVPGNSCGKAFDFTVRVRKTVIYFTVACDGPNQFIFQFNLLTIYQSELVFAP